VKALILYVGLVIVGAVLSTLLGIYLEHAVNSTVSLIVFLACFFANFVVSWIIVIYMMDGTLKAEA
jgi:ABC-type polysaccharide transport system permease subunit